jgi:hypothetical protein
LEAAESGVSHPEVSRSLERRIAALEEEKQLLAKQLEQATRQTHEQQLMLLCSIPGIGVKSACFLLAELGEIDRFDNAAKLVHPPISFLLLPTQWSPSIGPLERLGHSGVEVVDELQDALT